MRPALVISSRDNVATALEPLEPGRRLELNGISFTVEEPVAPGHKVALRRIAAGEPVIKYGSPIGLASAEIGAGRHVHTHNLSSTRGRGDLGDDVPVTEPRLAEPPDDAGAPPAGSGDEPPAAGASPGSPAAEGRPL